MSSLMARIRVTADRAEATGALVSLPTETVIVTQRGIPFVVHVSALQASKARAGRAQDATSISPFLPPDRELVIGEIAPRHLAVLNKFNVLDRHLLIVTRDFEPQDDLLNVGDFEALARCLSEFDGLGFYNAGTVAGASQPHKHLQLVPLPLGDGPHPTPIDAVIDRTAPVDHPSIVDAFPFRHVLIPLGNGTVAADDAQRLCELYDLARQRLGLDDRFRPYNLLLTHRWMLVVPRSREFWCGVSVNALGFAGSLLVRNAAELETLRRATPLSVLRSVVEPDP